MLDYLNTRLNKQSHVGEHQVRNLVGATPGSHILLLFCFVFDKTTRQSHSWVQKQNAKAPHSCISAYLELLELQVYPIAQG